MAIVNDGIVSLASSLGQRSSSRDFVAGKRFTDKQLSDLYETNWLVRKYIDVRTTDMMRLDREVLTPDFDNKLYESASQRLGAHKAGEEVQMWASLYGDALVLAVTDNEDLAEEVGDDEKIQRFIVLDKTAYDFEEVEDDVTSANFGKPRMYWLTSNKETLIHNSRVYRLEAGKRSFKERTSRNKKYGQSDIQAIRDPLFNYLTVCANIFDIVEESKSDVLYIDGFNAGIASGREDDYKQLAISMGSIKSSTGSMFLDATARWEQKELTFGGLTDIMGKARDDLAGALRFPLTKLFGQSASGFASGLEDAENYNQDIASLQESRRRPVDEFFDKFILPEIGSDLRSLDFKYTSIELVNETEKSTILTNYVNAFNTLLQSGIINEVQFAKELKNKDLINLSDEDIAELEELVSEPTAEDTTAQIESGEAEQTGGGVLPQANAFASGLNAITGNN